MKNIAKCFFVCFLMLSITPNLLATNNTLAEKTGLSDTTHISHFLEQGEYYLNINRDSTFQYFELAHGHTKALFELYVDSAEASPDAYALTKYLHANSLYKYALAYRSYGYYSQAVKMMLESQQLFDDFRFMENNRITREALAGLASCYLNLALIFEVLQSPVVSEEKMMLAKKYAHNIADQDLLFLFYMESARFYFDRADTSSFEQNRRFWMAKADSSILQAESISYNRDNQLVKLRSIVVRARQVALRGDFNQSIQLLTEAEKMLPGLNNNYWAALSYSVISATYLSASQFDSDNKRNYLLKSISSAEKGLAELKPIGAIQIEKKLNNLLRNAWGELGNIVKYRQYAEAFIKNRDSMVGLMKRGTISALEQEYLLAVEERKSSELLLQRDALNERIASERLILLALFMLFLFAIIAMILLNKGRNKKQKLLKKISENESHLKSLVQSIPGTIYRCLPDEDYTMIYLSDEVETLTGYVKEDFLTKKQSFNDLIHPDDREEVAKQVIQAILDQRSYVLEYRIIKKNGLVAYVFAKGIAEYDHDGKPAMLNGTILDITERKRGEVELKSALTRISKLTSSAPVSIITWDLDTTIIEWNAQAEKTFGWSRQEATGRSYLELNVMNPQDFDKRFIRQQVLDGTIKTHTEHENITKDGRIIFCEWNNAIIYDDDGKPLSVISMANDITDKIAAERELNDIYNLSDRALELTKSGFWQIKLNDLQHFVASDRAKEIFGFVALETAAVPELATVLKQIAVLDSDMATFISQKLNKVFTGEEDNFEIEHQYQHPQTLEPLWIKSIAYIEKDEKGKPMSLYGVSQDITLTKRLQKDLEAAREAAEAATKAKSDFLANMSHEIRTPMNAIIGMTHLVQKTTLDDKQADYVSKISRSANALLGIINDILDFSKIEAGKLTIENIDFELQEVLNGVTDLILQKAQQKNLEFLIRIDPSVPAYLVGDPLRLGQVITNLCSNAVKFTETGEIVVDVSFKNKTEQTIGLLVEVKDSGIGLSPDQQKKLFQAFSQADTSTTRKYGGTGLGLTISQNLVRLMNGTIGVESEAGKGSNFYFNIECGISNKEHQNDFKTPVDVRGLKVMVCDDNETAREILAEALRAFTFEVVLTAGTQEAIEQLRQSEGKDVELLLLDYKMPDINGLEAITLIQNDPLILHKPKIIMVSAYGKQMMENHENLPLIEGFIEKPLNYSALFNSIMNVFGNHSHHRLKNEASDDELIYKLNERSGNVILLVEDNEINQQVAKEIIEETGLIVEIAGNGQIAVEMVLNSGNPSKYQLVLMDLQMPVMDGITATQEIRKVHDYITLPILAMTADAMSGVREKVLEAGMMDMLTKPIDPMEVYKKILKWMDRAGSIGVPKQQPAQLDSISKALVVPKINGLETEVALFRLNGNKKLYLSILWKFYESNLHFIEEVRQLIPAGDYESLKRQFHTLKGLSGSIGAAEIQQLALELEQLTEGGQAEKLPALLTILDEKLQQLFSEIQTKLQHETPAVESINPSLVQPLISDLDTMIRKKSPQAKKLLAELEKAGVNDPVFQKLKQALATFNFKEAALLLEELKSKLIIP